MIITIDTDKDRPEQLRKAAQFLLELAGDSTTNVSEPESVDVSDGMFGMFDSPDEEEPKPKSDEGFSVLPY